MIELRLETPTGYLAHRVIVAELDIECEPEIVVAKEARLTDAGTAHHAKHNTGPCSIGKLKAAIERWPINYEFAPDDLREFTNRRLSSYLPRLVKQEYLERVGKRLSSGNKPFFVYRRTK